MIGLLSYEAHLGFDIRSPRLLQGVSLSVILCGRLFSGCCGGGFKRLKKMVNFKVILTINP
jgi:hypothetical protein